MRKNLLYMIPVAAMALLNVKVVAQNTVHQGNVTVQANKLEQRGDSLYINIEMTILGKSVNARKSADFTPILVAKEYNKMLPEVSIKGRNSYANHLRYISLMNKKEKATYFSKQPYAVIRERKSGNKTVDYNLVIPYEAWMADARLDLMKNDCGCGISQTTDVKTLVNSVAVERLILAEPYQITPVLAYVQPLTEIQKRRVEQQEAFLDFAVGKITIHREFGANMRELEKIGKMVENVRDDKGVTIKDISIIGYASPEGSIANNQRLSEGRAKALQTYLQSTYPAISKSLYHIHFGGENWKDLLKILKTSELSYKQDVIDIIENVPVTANREARIMALKGGVPYRYMLKELFPSLRKSVVSINYSVKNFNVEEAREIIKTRPQNLSLNEMFVVAQTCEKGSQEFNEIFETAVRMFPEDETAMLNAAASLLARKDVVGAERYLNKIRTMTSAPEYINAMGVLEMLKGNLDKAEAYLKAAFAAGVEVATDNLAEIEKKRKEGEVVNKK